MSLFSLTRIDCHSRCYICDTSVNNCEEYFVCVICKQLYHFQCSGLTESDLKFTTVTVFHITAPLVQTLKIVIMK